MMLHGDMKNLIGSLFKKRLQKCIKVKPQALYVTPEPRKARRRRQRPSAACANERNGENIAAPAAAYLAALAGAGGSPEISAVAKMRGGPLRLVLSALMATSCM